MAIINRKSRAGTTSYIVRVRDYNGRWFPATTYDRRVDAERRERELLSLRDTGSTATPNELRALTVQQFVEKWSLERRANVSGGWKVTQDQMIRAYILPTLGGMKLLDVKQSKIGAVLNAMEAAKLGAQTRLHVFNLMHRIFGDALGYYHLISSNPVTMRDKPAVIRVEQKHLKPTEAKTLLGGSRDRYIGPAIWLATLGALRPNEVQALRFDAIDFERNVIEIRAGFKRKVNRLEPYPKGKRKGEVPMPQPLRELLVELSIGKDPGDFVIPGVRGEILSYGTFLSHLTAILAELKLPLVTPHKLRHSATELWIEQGATEEDLIRLLNHSGAGAIRGYIHRSSERLHALASKIDIVAPKVVERPRLMVVR